MTNPVSLESSVAVTTEQVSCDLAGEAVVLNLVDGQYYELNSVGARVWELLQDGRTVLEIRDTLLGEYDVESDRCTAELLAVLEALTAAQLIRIVA